MTSFEPEGFTAVGPTDADDEAWVQAQNRRRRVRMRMVAALLVLLLLIPLVITFFEQVRS